MKLSLLAPPAAVIVELHAAGFELAHNRVVPAGKLNGQARGLATEQWRCALDRLWQPKPLASGLNRRSVADFRLDRDNVRHGVSWCRIKKEADWVYWRPDPLAWALWLPTVAERCGQPAVAAKD